MTASSKPRVTMILFVYNQRAFVADAVRGCFAQVGEPIEILLSDDVSTDGSFELMTELAATYSGPHRVRLRRNERNLGIGEHYNRAIAESGGQLLMTAGGDDISLPERAATLLQHWDAAGGKPDLVASHAFDMNIAGENQGVLRVADLARWNGPDAWVKKRPYVIGATHAFTRRLHDRFGNFIEGLEYEDQAMALRACCMGGGITVGIPLVRYRRGGLSSSTASRAPSDDLCRSLKRFTRQRTLFQQVRKDLRFAGRGDLWGGKVERYLLRSELALRMLSEPRALRCLLMGLRPRGAGWYWALRHAVRFAMSPGREGCS